MTKGRPPAYTPDEIEKAQTLYLELLHRGFNERELDAVEDLPGHTYRSQWKDDPSFAERCRHARAIGADYKLHAATEKLDYAWERAVEDSASPQLVGLAESYMKHARWLASKHNREVYGDKLQTELTGKDGGPVEMTSADHAIIAQTLALLKKDG